MSSFGGDSNFDRLARVEARDPPAWHRTNVMDIETVVDIFLREDGLRKNTTAYKVLFIRPNQRLTN